MITFPHSLNILLAGKRPDEWRPIEATLARCFPSGEGNWRQAASRDEAEKRLLEDPVDVVLLAIASSDELPLVQALAAFKRPLIVVADIPPPAGTGRSASLGPADWLEGEEATNPAVLVRALHGALQLHAVSAHRQREVQLSQLLDRMTGVEILQREAAHDLGNTLTPAQLLACRGQAVMEDPAKSLFAQIEQSVGESADSLARMQNLRRSLDGASSPKVVAIDAIVKTCLKSLRRRLPRHVELVLEMEDAAGEEIFVDEGELPQAIIDLATNGLRAMRDQEAGQLRLSLERTVRLEDPDGDGTPRAFTVLRVIDTGEGIEPNMLDRIFEPFFTTRAGEGAVGLGLFNCRRFMERHGGLTRVESVPGEGTTVELLFPKASDALEEPPEGPYSFTAGNLTVLLVDADEHVLTLTAQNLRRLGVKVITASDARAARQQFFAYEDKIDLVLLDPELPDEHGARLWRDLKDRRRSLHLIVMSNDERAFPSEVDDARPTLRKPLRLAELAQRIEEVLNEEEATGTNGR